VGFFDLPAFALRERLPQLIKRKKDEVCDWAYSYRYFSSWPAYSSNPAGRWLLSLVPYSRLRPAATPLLSGTHTRVWPPQTHASLLSTTHSRMYAMMHLAIHDALNAIDRRFQPYVLDKPAEPGAFPDAAVAAAARDVLVPLLAQLPRELPFIIQSCIDASIASVETAYTAALAALPDGPAKTQGIAVGQAAAAAILARRAADGAVGPFLNSNCPQESPPGKYQCTPGFRFIAFEVWGKVNLFVLQDSAQFRPGPPYALNDKNYTADFNEVKSLGGDGLATPSARTADQTEIAYFWWESSPLKWNRIARAVSVNAGFTPWQNARLFGLLNMALADGYVAAMSATKNHYNYWRPVTAIRTGETDGNSDTVGDPPGHRYVRPLRTKTTPPSRHSRRSRC
jgi:hypothetical protein